MNAIQLKLPVRLSRRQLRSTTALSVALGVGAAGVGLGLALCHLRPAKAAAPVVGAANPEALPPGVHLVACNPCNPCAAKVVSPCNPCAAANPCNPCAAASPCNPCVAANPCNPCNPCAASAGAATECVIPRIQTAALGNPCNPCAAANPCNPCAANPCSPCAAAGPCNPCAAAGPCNPCAAANPCNPCNPCAAGAAVELTDVEAATVYDCVLQVMQSAYAGADDPAATQFPGWTSYSLIPYQSATHGSRYVMNYANAAGRAYGRYEDAGTVPAGAKLAKNSFTVGADGQVALGPLFLMEKMSAGFREDGGDWRYTMIMPGGSTFGVTNGHNAAGVEFCHACHAVVGAEQDYLYFLPEDYRVAKR